MLESRRETAFSSLHEPKSEEDGNEYDVNDADQDGDEDDEEESDSNEGRHSAAKLLRAATEQVARTRKEAPTRKAPRRSAPRFGPNILLGPNGFGVLRKLVSQELENWPTKYPSDDESYSLVKLNQLMRIYREWIISMYPKFKFRDTVDKTERHCRTAPLKAYLMALRRSHTDGADFNETQFIAERDAEEARAALTRTIEENPS